MNRKICWKLGPVPYRHLHYK